jgi:hypothetical protein
VQSSRNIQPGARVRILAPDYVVGKIGIILSQETVSSEQLSDRWVIQVESEEIVLSLFLDEF